MKEIRNTTRAPLRVPLGGGRVLHLGPGQTGNVADDAPKRPGVARMIRDGKLEVLGTEGTPVESADGGGAAREFAQGHAHATRVFPKGNRGG